MEGTVHLSRQFVKYAQTSHSLMELISSLLRCILESTFCKLDSAFGRNLKTMFLHVDSAIESKLEENWEQRASDINEINESEVTKKYAFGRLVMIVAILLNLHDAEKLNI